MRAKQEKLLATVCLATLLAFFLSVIDCSNVYRKVSRKFTDAGFSTNFG